MRTTLATLAVAALALAGCSSTDTSAEPQQTVSETPSSGATTSAPSQDPVSPTTSDTPTPTRDAGTVIDISVNGDRVTPKGERVKATIGSPIILKITSDREGELHVHSTPEQELEYGVGKTSLRIVVDKPGIIDIEDHIAEIVIVQLEVS